jgi:Right handed beta helix region
LRYVAATLMLLGFLGFGVGSVSAASYYVSLQGDDSNPGTSPARAWRTVAKVNSVDLRPGDIVHFQAGGLWRETLEPLSGGAPGRPVTFTAYGKGPKPIINGSRIVRDWSVYRGSIYRASLRDNPKNVYVDGGPGWGLHKASSTASMLPGSWYWNQRERRLYVRLADGSEPAGHVVEAATRIYGMKVIANAGEKGYIVVDGLGFERVGGAGIYFYSNADGGHGLSGVVVRNCIVRQTGTGRIDDGSYYNGIHFSQAVQLPSAPRFIDNVMSYTGNHGNGINSQNADGAEIAGNRADHFNHHGFDTKHSDNVVIRDNVAHDSKEANGIYQEYCQGGTIERNVVYNLTGSVPGRGSGIQIDVGSTGAHIHNNTIYNVVTGIYLINPAVAKRNIVAGASNAALSAGRGGSFDYNDWGPHPVILYMGRSYDLVQWRALGGHSHDIASAPRWIDPDNGDFRLPPGSPGPVSNDGGGTAVAIGAPAQRLSPEDEGPDRLK